MTVVVPARGNPPRAAVTRRAAGVVPVIRREPTSSRRRPCWPAVLLLALVGLAPAASRATEAPSVRTIVLVHGALTDGSAWRGVYDILTRDGYDVRIVQQPLTGLDDDVAATRRVLDQLPGPVVLVGHSYGGTVITVAGTDPKVRALVYVAALQPDVGESTNRLAASRPGRVPASDLVASGDGFVYVRPERFPEDVAGDLRPEQAQFLAKAQMPVAAAAFDAVVPAAAWHDKPSFGIVATDDLELSPALAHWMYARSGTRVTELRGSHLVHVSHPREVARVIESVARGVH